jgi:hypothetical protein
VPRGEDAEGVTSPIGLAGRVARKVEGTLRTTIRLWTGLGLGFGPGFLRCLAEGVVEGAGIAAEVVLEGEDGDVGSVDIFVVVRVG